LRERGFGEEEEKEAIVWGRSIPLKRPPLRAPLSRTVPEGIPKELQAGEKGMDCPETGLYGNRLLGMGVGVGVAEGKEIKDVTHFRLYNLKPLLCKVYLPKGLFTAQQGFSHP